MTSKKFEDNLKDKFLICPHCQGKGMVGEKKCGECNGRRVYLVFNSQLFYWGKDINGTHILQDKLGRNFTLILNLILLLVGISGLMILAWEIFVFNQDLSTNIFSRIWNQSSLKLLYFWFTILTDTFLIYRYWCENQKIKSLPKTKARLATLVPENFNWFEANRTKGNLALDISPYFSQKSVSTLEKSWELAVEYKHYQIAPLHLFIALLMNPEIVNIFIRLGVSFDNLRKKIARSLPTYATPQPERLYFNLEYQKILFNAFVEAWDLKQKKVELADLLMALVKNSILINEMLYDLKIDLNKINNVAIWFRVQKMMKLHYQYFRSRAALRPKTSMNRSMTAVATPFLDQFGQDLTQLAKFGNLEPCIGREKEIKKVFQILSSGTKQGVILIGLPGIGRRTIVNGIAQQMVTEDVPPIFQDKRLVSLNVAKLISGATPSEIAQRLLIIINEIRRSGNIIIFINDISKMTGIAPGAEGSMDIATVLSQALSQRQLIVISTATTYNYTRYIENKSSLSEVLEKINIEELHGDEAIQVLEAKAGIIEYKTGVFFSYDAIAKTVELAERYMHERYMPEKAIEILEETAIKIANLRGQDATVTDSDVAQVISDKTEIPMTEITQEETEKLLNLENEIHKRLVDQEEAVSMVSAAIRRSRAEMRDISRPIVNLLFLGPTGVGKTELAKTVTRVYFGKTSELVRLDMSEYQEKSSINRLIGAPPGFEGEGEGYLTESIRKNPYCVLLLDEIEKAHPDILNVFLQVMDDGRLTDTSGRTIDFTSVILIGTSNACTPLIQERVKQGMSVEQIKNELMEGALQKYFRPEFLNRFDGVIVFKPLSVSDVIAVTKIMLAEIAVNLEEKGIKLEVTKGAVEELANAGFDPQYGARPLRRILQKYVSDVITDYLISRQINRRDTIIFDVGGKIDIIKHTKI